MSASDRNDVMGSVDRNDVMGSTDENDEMEHLVPSSADDDEDAELSSKWTESSEPEKLALLFDSCTAQFSNKCPEKDQDRYRGTNISRELRV